MRLSDFVRRNFLRGRGLWSLLLFSLSVLVLTVAGSLWLIERGHGWIVGLLIGLPLAIRGIELLYRWRPRATAPSGPGEGLPQVPPNPEWSDREEQVYQSLLQDIRDRLRTPVDWPALQPIAWEILESAAQRLSDGRRHALDFSLPEALLLADRILMRLRETLRTDIPYSDRISLRNLLWLWAHRDRLQAGARVARTGWRISRLARSPVAAIAQEIQNLLLSDAGETLRSLSVTQLQALVLEELARAAIDLHAGHLRFSDAELLRIELGSEITDRRILAQPDQALRLLIVGQISAGKSTLVNALLGESRAETDMAPTTPAPTRHDLLIDGTPFHLIDTHGIDGSDAVAIDLLAQMLDSDLIVWVIRANRPARAPDVDLLARFDAELTRRPGRRRPPLIVAVTGVDLLLEGWPFPEDRIPAGELERIASILSAIRQDMGDESVVPVRAAAPVWNIDLLAASISDATAEALMTQRNRRRIEGHEQQRGWRTQLRRSASGTASLARVFGGRLRSGWRATDPPGES
ncbi:MAG: GTPase [Burkholderiaceae bacterium]